MNPVKKLLLSKGGKDIPLPTLILKPQVPSYYFMVLLNILHHFTKM